MHQSSSKATDKKKEEYIYKSTLFKNYYDKTTFKVKDENGKVIADKKNADLTVKEKT
jgi:CRISPR/Cas system CMR-associated protein Cmr3 (group 5 of RAMP superfamily)